MTKTITRPTNAIDDRSMTVPRWAWRFPGILDLPGERSFRIEEIREEHCTLIRAELPGMDADDLDVTVEGNVLTMRGERRTETSSDDRDRIHSEFHYGMFERRMTLPEGSHVDGITATYDAGILELRIPMDGDRPEARRIAVSTPNG